MDEDQDLSLEELSSAPFERLACNRCRQRKVKCDRGCPCSHCVKAKAQCSYAPAPKPRERRQRVMVSTTYDSKLDEISKKLDGLTQALSQLDHGPRNAASKPRELAKPVNSPSFGLTPSNSSLGSTPNSQDVLVDGPSSEPIHGVVHTSSQGEYEGESSLFAHAVFASRFLQNAIDNTTDAHVAHEMKSVLDALGSAVYSGKQQADALDNLYPLAKPMPPSSTIRDLPLPPMETVFRCFRMAKECPQVAMLWLGSYITPSQFNDYFFKVASPGPVSEADLVIVHCGLFWLFCECAKAAPDMEVRRVYNAQTLICEGNLQMVLANLRFHQPTNMDHAYAMGMASLYCLQKSKPSAAWNFISSASQIVQALGLQHNAIGTEGPEAKAQKRDMFWTIYMTEKMLSLRLGRASTFRDQDITLSRPAPDRPGSNFLAELAPGWITIASIQGRIYDEIYSPGALMQPPHIRTSRASELADELKIAMHHAQEIHDRYQSDKGLLLGLDFHEIARRSDRVIGLSMLTLIYRSIPSEKPSTFCQECIDTARETLQEHDRCIDVIDKAQGRTVFLEAYINWTITNSPFTPFIILFCHIIETSDGSDLEYMRSFVETLNAASYSRIQNTCDRQRRLFKALHDVAAKYIEVKSRGATTEIGSGYGPFNSGVAQMSSSDFTSGHPGKMGFTDAMVVPSLLQNTNPFDDLDLDMDLSGAQLWDWFHKNQNIMRMLEDI